MNIQTVEIKTGLTKRMIRHYEEFSLIKPVRNINGYREYTDDDVSNLLCIKAMRELGFSLSEISNIIKDGKTEETLRRHFNELLIKQQEEFNKHHSRLKTIKAVLKSNEISNQLLDKIVTAQLLSDNIDGVDGLNDFLKKYHIVRGNIKPVTDLSKIAKFGSQREFNIIDITYITYGGLFEENILPRASISICKELYAYILLFTESGSKFGANFHKDILEQFSTEWSQVSWPLTTKFDALTEDINSLDRIFSPFNLVVSITAQNQIGEKFSLAIPGQPLVVYLSQKSGTEYNSHGWLEK